MKKALKLGVPADSLASALGLEQGGQVALVGGGGKTSLMFALARELLNKGRRVITGTTTKVWEREAHRSPCVVALSPDSDPLGTVKPLLEQYGHVFVARDLSGKGKVSGITRAQADALYREPWVDYLILEADGSAGLPVKAPEDHEPVIPASTTSVVAVMGLEAVGSPFEPDIVFRPGLFEAVTGLGRGETLTPEALARLFHSPRGLFKGAPLSARRIAFLNKLDLLQGDRDTRALAGQLLKAPNSRTDMVVIGSVTREIYFRSGGRE